MVRIVSRHVVKPPSVAEQIVQNKHHNGYELSFTYKAEPAKLQMWLGGIPHLIDVTIADHTLESAFEDLYALETSKEPNV